MDLMLLFGLVLAGLSIFYGIPDMATDYKMYLDTYSTVIVFGGTLAAIVISTSSVEIKNMGRAFKLLLIKPKTVAPADAIKVLVRISELAQKTTKQALVDEARGVGDGFLERALGLVASGLDKDFIRRTLETDIYEIQRRHAAVSANVRLLGSYAPMFGALGTVLGIVKVLVNVTNVDSVIAGMSLALITTIYGLVLSSFIFIPIANKLKGLSAGEVLTKEIMMEGVLAIIDKEIPLKVEQYLNAYIGTGAKKSGKK
jgi:chemotaxis protein MotA